MLRAGAGEDECDLADQCIPCPQATCLVEEGFICLAIMPKSLLERHADLIGLLSLQR